MIIKISSGKLRGRKIAAPSGIRTRPTSGRLKKSLFDVLAPVLPGARVLDLFAGAGALGLEALSRGAGWAVFVDRARSAARAIRENLERLGLSGQGEVLQRDALTALHALSKRGERFDVVFVDPPYRAAGYGAVLERIDASGLLSSRGVVVVEHHHKASVAERYGELVQARRLRAGESCLSFFRRGSDAASAGTAFDGRI
jgi:16S rRNA (guanine(966)-N(2))-methyltransferase RsmD